MKFLTELQEVARQYDNAELVFNPLLVDTTLEDSRYGHVCGINHLMQLIGEPAISDATFYAMSQELYEIVKNKLAS